MAKNHILNDFRAVTRGLEKVLTTTAKQQQKDCRRKWEFSSVNTLLQQTTSTINENITNFNKEDFTRKVKESYERTSMVYYGIKEFALSSTPVKNNSSIIRNQPTSPPSGITEEDLKIVELAKKDKELIHRLEKEYEEKLANERKKGDNIDKEKSIVNKPKEITNFVSEIKTGDNNEKQKFGHIKIPIENSSDVSQMPTVKKYVTQQTLNPEAKQRKVPSSRLARMVSFGSLAAGLGVGTVAEAARRTLGLTDDSSGALTLDKMFLSEANTERIVSTLCKVRGAALKIGQILSIQDNATISPALQKAFERVRQSADFMPTWQVHKVLASELGPNWRSMVANFEEKPFAAASIGQVHRVTLLNGRDAAMKIQYPGVAQGIDSDINNLVGILKIWDVFPKGLFIDNLVTVAKRELAWEVDYEREKECTKRFYSLLEPFPNYVVPEVVDELSTKKVFTTLLIDGIPVDKCVDLDVTSREHVARLIMDLCLHELFDFRYMQTDPNWSNFFYNPDTRKLSLLDFGASRSYTKEFMDQYIEVIKGAADRDRDKVLKLSQEMGFLTGYESKAMEAAHVDAVMILGEVFASSAPFNFGRQDTTKRIQQLVPTIVSERLCPPPEEIYSLHRKLSGVFLLCAKLNVQISCRDLFLDIYKKYD